MKNQENPETDEDVIDWLQRNLIESGRTRREIIMKLKSLGLIFKAPTKRSNALAAGKRTWTPEQDERLKGLYDDFRLEENCLERIMETMALFKSQNAVVNRMITLGLIADRSEIVTRKRKSKAKKPKKGQEEGEYFGSNSEESEEESKKRETGKFNAKQARIILNEIEDSHKEAIDWLIESLTDALEDLDDLEDGIALVPLNENQMEALNNEVFTRFMLNLGLQTPDAMEQYWRIPSGLKESDIQKMLKILKNEGVFEEEIEERRRDSSDDEDDAENMFGIWRQKANNALVYHESDNEENAPKINKKKIKKPKSKKKSELEEAEEVKEPEEPAKAESEEEEEEEDELGISTQKIRERLNELESSDDDEEPQTSNKKSRTILDSDSEEEEEDQEKDDKNDETADVIITKSRKRSRSNSDSEEDDEPKVIRKTKTKRLVLSDEDDD